MPIGIITGILEGMQQGKKEKEEREIKKQLLDFQTRKFKLEEEEGKIKNLMLRRQFESGELLNKLLSPQPSQQGNFIPFQEGGLEGTMMPPQVREEALNAPAPPQDPLANLSPIARAMIAQNPALLTQILPEFQKPEGPIELSPGATLLRPGQEPFTAPFKPEKEPAPTLDRDLEAEAQRRGLTGNAAFEFKQQERARLTGMRTAAAEGEKPVGQETQRSLAGLADLSNMAGRLQEKFKPDYVGKLDKVLGGLREFTGQITPDEVVFRKDVLDMQDALLRARSGAQINEQEFRRLTKFLPNISDQEVPFLAALDRFQKEVELIKSERLRLATTPKKELKKPKSNAAPSGGPPKILKITPVE